MLPVKIRIQANTAAPNGTSTVVHRMNDAEVNKELSLIENSAIPVDILSIKEYAPKTNAPLSPRSPITSEMSVIAVFSIRT